MNGYYLYVSFGDNSSGVIKKIEAQCAYFSENGLRCTPFPIREADGFWKKIFYRIPLGSDIVEWPDVDSILGADFLYIRKTTFTIQFCRFVAKIKKRKPNLKIFIELPTYPYWRDVLSAGIKNITILLRDCWGRRIVRRYIDGLIVIGLSGDRLWGIPVVQFKNGIDINHIRCRKPAESTGQINILCMASFAPYHGVDVMIRGMIDYYRSGGDRDIHLYLAGNESRLETEKQLLSENPDILGERVHIMGHLSGDSLQSMYDICDIGIVSLGYSRIGLRYNTTIKSKEYLAVGMPVICDTEIDILEGEESKYVLYTDYGASSADVKKIIEFYDGIYEKEENKIEVAHRIRDKYLHVVDINRTIQPVIEMIRG